MKGLDREKGNDPEHAFRTPASQRASDQYGPDLVLNGNSDIIHLQPHTSRP